MTARELFLKICEKDGWHGIVGNHSEQRKAAMDKKRAIEDKLSHNKYIYWLDRLGYECKQKEVWGKKE